MLFSSLTFLYLFLPIVLILYFLIPNLKYKNAVLLISSLVFYSWGEPKNILLMLLAILIVYISGLVMDKSKKHKKLILIVTIIILLSFLMYYKYVNFFISNINNIFNVDINLLNVLMPIGISFFTFQALSYSIDLYRGKVKLQKSFFKLALYVSFFPQLIAGPIVRYDTVEDELSKRKHKLDDVVVGFKRFIIGLSKKIIIANQMALIADVIFDNSLNNSIGTLGVWIGALAFTFQLYFDFSGYSDMAIGLGRMFGFHFLENFNYPYIATSIRDFWKRWHISLTTWFKDYVYIPLGGNKVGKVRWIINIFIVWLLTGFWHGASWNFILWGLYYFILLLIEKLVISKIHFKVNKVFKWAFTFILIIFGWTIFRSNNLDELVVLFRKMIIFTQTNITDVAMINVNFLVSLIYFIPAIIFSFPIFKKINQKFKDNVCYVFICDVIYFILLIICIVFLTSSNYNPFIYFRF